MIWEAIAAVSSLLGLIATVLGVAYVSGKLTQRVEDNSKRTDAHASMLATHGQLLTDHEVKIGRLQEWKDGFAAGSRTHGTNHRADAVHLHAERR